MSCTFPLCQFNEYRDGYCIHHAKHFAGVKVADKSKPIPLKSLKRMVEEKLYKKIVNEMMAVSDRCEIKEPGCTGKAEGLHHKRGRGGKDYLNRKYLIRACNKCHSYVEAHPLDAVKKGYSISRLS